MKLNLKFKAAASIIVLLTPQAFAATQLGDYVTFSGFGTLGVVQTNTDQGQFARADYEQTAGATTHASFDVDSDLGLQLTAKPTQWLSATVQTLTQQRTTNLDTEVEWAYLKLQPVKNLSLLAGRMALPMFLVSDFRNVGYANNWIRPPDEVYGLALLTRLQGAELSYALPIHSSMLTLTGVAGESKLDARDQEFDGHRLKGGNAQWELDWITLRVGYVETDVSTQGVMFHYSFEGVGASIDRNNFVFQTEYVQRRVHPYPQFSDADGWYAMAGYRFSPFLPYVSYSRDRDLYPFPFTYVSPPQSTISAGVRWDAFKSIDVKFQIDRVNTYGGPGVSFITPTLAVEDGFAFDAGISKPVMVFSLALDVVF
jgi:Gram-negative porin